MAMVSFSRGDWGRLLLRVAFGGLMLFHGVGKIRSGIGGIEGMVTEHGLPQAFAYGVYVGEVLAPLLVMLGVLAVPAAAIMAFNMVVALWLGHAGEIFSLNDYGAPVIELPLIYLLGTLAIALLGPGEIGLRKPGK